MIDETVVILNYWKNRGLLYDSMGYFEFTKLLEK